MDGQQRRHGQAGGNDPDAGAAEEQTCCRSATVGCMPVVQQHERAATGRDPGSADAIEHALGAEPGQGTAGAGHGESEHTQPQACLEQAACADPVQKRIGGACSKHIAERICRVEPTRLRIGPLQILAHGGKQQCVGKSSQAVGNRHRQAQGEGWPQ